jgi:uncharacterized protein YxjI
MKKTKGDLLSNTYDVKNSKFVANNTLRIEYANGNKAIRLHNTDVVTIKDDVYTLNSGGWRTSTTKDRINTFSPARVWQTNGQWFTGGSLFYDGITVNKDGKVISKVMRANDKKVNAMKKQIAKYVALITKDNLPVPSNGDCWLCLLRDQDGHTMGENDNSHLLSHLKEKYLHGSILVNAMREAGYKDQQIGFHYQMKLSDTFKRSLRKYLQKRLIKDIAVK